MVAVGDVSVRWLSGINTIKERVLRNAQIHTFTYTNELKCPPLRPLMCDLSSSSPTPVKGHTDDMCHPLLNIPLSCFSASLTTWNYISVPSEVAPHQLHIKGNQSLLNRQVWNKMEVQVWLDHMRLTALKEARLTAEHHQYFNAVVFISVVFLGRTLELCVFFSS